MKTYSILYAILALVIISCTKSSDTPSEIEQEETFFNADYILLQHINNNLTTQLLNTTESSVTLNTAESNFVSVPVPEITFQKESIFGHYNKMADCSGQITIHNFDDDSSKNIDIFTDLNGCNLTATAFTIEANTLYVSYMIEETSKLNKYFVRIIDINASEESFLDVELDKKPMQLAFTNGRLFILTIDLEITDEYSLSVVDGTTNTLIHEIGLGYDVARIFPRTDYNLIISYPELHTVLNSSTMSVEYISYETGKEPNFYDSEFYHFDAQGKLFYKRPTDDANHPNIPAIYDFSNNLTVLYYYENFLTGSQLEFEYKIGDTTMVSYDDKNNIMLVGYQKNDNENKGGLLRIQLEPIPELLDNLDLEGVPYQIFYQ
ncbi:MAG: hypothetical protein WBM53_08175 [Maribacter sp.]